MATELACIDSEALLPDPICADWVEVVSADKQSPNNIFLSHSGAQKNFVEQLCEDLERAKQSPFFDKRPQSLPKGARFAPLIFTAIKNCDLAVVVVSEEYFIQSKWPMLELAEIVQAAGCRILPLFFGLSCKKYKNLKRREKWFQAWDEWSKQDNRICLDTWQAALWYLDGVNGMEYVKANGEVTYRREIVTTVCDMMQQRSLLHEIIVADANECDLHQPGIVTTAARSKLNLCVPSGCLTSKAFLLPVVVGLTMLLLSCGYVHYVHDNRYNHVYIPMYSLHSWGHADKDDDLNGIVHSKTQIIAYTREAGVTDFLLRAGSDPNVMFQEIRRILHSIVTFKFFLLGVVLINLAVSKVIRRETPVLRRVLRILRRLCLVVAFRVLTLLLEFSF